MNDYTWPSIYFAYLFFTLMGVLALFFLVKSIKDGYWGARSEDPKYTMFEEDPMEKGSAR